MEIMRYEYYDREKDFTKVPYSILPKHKIYPLSEQGLNKYLNQRKFVLEMLKNNSKTNKTLSIENQNNSLYNKSQNKYINTNDCNENKDKEINENNKTPRKGISLNKTRYFEPIIIGRTLKNRYLMKNKKSTLRNTLFTHKTNLTFSDLPLIQYNKLLGSRKIEINNFNAYINSSNFSKTITNHKSYFMGEAYNPNNYMLDNTKNRTKRNDFGSLFLN